MSLVAVAFHEDQFDAWSAHTQQEYAQEKIASGAWLQAEAAAKAREDHAKLLPHGLATPGQHIRRVEDAETRTLIGWFWVGPAAPGPADLGWLYDIEIVTEHRGHGYGRELMALAEAEARAMGFARLGLHVFAQNHAARHLYEATGFETTDLTMVKAIE